MWYGDDGYPARADFGGGRLHYEKQADHMVSSLGVCEWWLVLMLDKAKTCVEAKGARSARSVCGVDIVAFVTYERYAEKQAWQAY
jgi:hypothetical protein